MLPLDWRDGPVTPVHATPNAWEYAVAVPPDRRYIAYTSNETGVDHVFVETLPKGGGKWQISTTNGTCPVFSRDGKELYFAANETVMAVEIDTRSAFHAGEPKALFTGPYEVRWVPQRNFDVLPDGRFVVVKRAFVASAPRELVVLDGWMSLERSVRP